MSVFLVTNKGCNLFLELSLRRPHLSNHPGSKREEEGGWDPGEAIADTKEDGRNHTTINGGEAANWRYP